MKHTVYLMMIAGLVIGCAQGNCRSQGKDPKDQTQLGGPVTTNEERIRVFKYDGSLQCGMGKAIAIEEMAKELKDIRIHTSVNKVDGLMHISQCGTPTGKANVYEIDRKDLPAAQKAGFKEWLWE